MYREFPLDKRYTVSSGGNVYSTRRGSRHRITYQEDISGKYLRACIGGKHYLVHRIVAITFIPNPENLPQVNHKDGNTHNNDVSNLEWVTPGDNQRHAYDIGLKNLPKGEDNGRHVLTDEEVLEIYQQLLNKVPLTELSFRYGVTTTQIGRIKTKEAWNHLLVDLPDMTRKFKTNKLTEDQVHKVCCQIVNGKTFKGCLEILGFNITKNQFYDIKRGRVYKHITDIYF